MPSRSSSVGPNCRFEEDQAPSPTSCDRLRHRAIAGDQPPVWLKRRNKARNGRGKRRDRGRPAPGHGPTIRPWMRQVLHARRRVACQSCRRRAPPSCSVRAVTTACRDFPVALDVSAIRRSAPRHHRDRQADVRRAFSISWRSEAMRSHSILPGGLARQHPRGEIVALDQKPRRCSSQLVDRQGDSQSGQNCRPTQRDTI